MRRHPGNNNLHLHSGGSFEGFPIQSDKGPFIREYLHRLKVTMESVLADYPRVFAFRVDLRLPSILHFPGQVYTNSVIDLFLKSFKAKIKHNRDMASRSNKRAHGCIVRYVWAREVGSYGRPHYHLLVLLNQDAFYKLGRRDSQNDNMYRRLDEAWASALGVPVEAVSGLVHEPDNAVYRLHRHDQGGQAELFYRASYLCKTATKVYGDGNHAFGASRS